jgi:hypothetical protein
MGVVLFLPKSDLMKHFFFIGILIFLLAACHQNGANQDVPKVEVKTGNHDTIVATPQVAERKIVQDSLWYVEDSLFSPVKLKLVSIKKSDFDAYQNNYRHQCEIDSGGFIAGSGLYVQQLCDEVCESFLCEKTTNRRMFLPSNYDSGVQAMLLSPSCNRMVVASSYDGPDYADYYEDRAEIFVFDVTTGVGVKGILPKNYYYTKNWSIEAITWANDETLALKVYEEARGGDDKKLRFKYFKIALP